MSEVSSVRSRTGPNAEASQDTGSPLSRRLLLRRGCAWCATATGLGLFSGAGHAQSAPAGANPAVGGAAGGAANGPAASDIHWPSARFERPAIDTDEGGLWAQMDREETRLRRSQFAVRDAGLARFLQGVIARLAGDHAQDIRVHVVRTPHFNASMAPNGMMQIWTGLLLRVENEAQLAAVLGHEIGHYVERHSLERLRDLKSRAAFAQFIGMFGMVGAIGQLGVLASAFSFSREQETRADRIGMRLMQRAGYDGREAARVWDNLVGELRITQGEDAGRRSPMMATHPPALDRRDVLLALAGSSGGETGASALREVVTPLRAAWLQDEVRRGQYEESLVLFDRLLSLRADDAAVLLARADVRRLRAEKDDLALARADLDRASTIADAPAEVFRALGLLHRQQADSGAAAAAFEKYLAAAPQAADAGLIKSYITELKP